MPRVAVLVQFGEIEQTSQVTGAEQEHMIAKIGCRVIYRDKPFDTYAVVKQIPGSKFDDADSIEVSRPIDYRGPLDFTKYVEVANRHFKNAIGATGRDITGHGSMLNNLVDPGNTVVVMDCEDAMSPAW